MGGLESGQQCYRKGNGFFSQIDIKATKKIDPTVHSSAPYISILGFFQLPFYIEEPS